MSYLFQAAQQVRGRGNSRPSDYFLLHPLPNSLPPSLKSAARVPCPFLEWALLLPVSEALCILLLVSARLPLKVTLTHADLRSNILQENIP